MKYAIFGAGIIGGEFLTEYWGKIEIQFVLDNQKEGFFHGKKLKKPEYREDVFIIVTSNRYYEIRKQLLSLGYSEFSDFVPYQIFDKKMAIAYGNCHMQAVRECLEHKKAFVQEYGFYPFPTIQTMNMLDNYMDVLKHCEMFIHQSIRKENKFGEEYSSESIMKYLSGKCQIISIPNLYGMPKWCFPQQKLDKERGIAGRWYFTAGEDVNIEKWIKEGKTKEEIKTYMVNGGVYKKEEILNMWEYFQERLFEREKQWDIKISDYIFDNYKTQKLFYDRLHISDILVGEISSRLLSYMGYDKEIYQEISSLMDGQEMFIYQDVIDAMGLEFKQKFIRLKQRNYAINKYEMDIDEYICLLYNYTRMPK